MSKPSDKPAKQPQPAQKPPVTPPAGKPTGETTRAKEVGGRDGPEPTRYGDWEVKGICVDF